MMHVGTRATEYQNGGKSVSTGQFWYECNRTITDFGVAEQIVKSGRKNVLLFKIDRYHVSSLAENANGYMVVSLQYSLSVVSA